MAIEKADQDVIEEYAHGVLLALSACGHADGWASDESLIWDFLSHVGNKEEVAAENSEILAELARLAGRPVTEGDLVWQVGRDIEARAQVH